MSLVEAVQVVLDVKNNKGHIMELRKLEKEEHSKTRELYERVFAQDTKEFLDYYYSVKTKDNEIYVIEEDEKIVSMIHLNPYQLRIGETIHPTNYIVAVATDANYRKRGLMGQLLKHTMREMYERKEPFTFLMPAAEAIYYPYDFRIVYTRKQGEMRGENNDSAVEIRVAAKEDCGKLVSFSNDFLKDYQVVAHRDEAYFEMMLAEQSSQDGGIVIMEKQEQIVGMFFYAKGERYEIREPLYHDEKDFKKAVYRFTKSEEEIVDTIAYGEGTRPIIMVRILHLETFLKTIKLEADLECYIKLEDAFISDNNGAFHVSGCAGQYISEVSRVTENQTKEDTRNIPVWKMGDLTIEIFKQAFPKVFLNEVV